ncbi:AAA family ATPase [Agathobaculum sp. NTUH-O15-33]|uniref:AAA family ATPase n=1 Tax=Agathobaculum sp. NTUH-O15-33 TaxID=3079302 RepID=UPI0029586DA9|nr:AAA family ATPase [Agathobaculum sp. NTUH-O15-33]WNX85643.1 AAA family ATPase [Agathobaculum sp. NTUH-O15-33]
MNIKRAKEEIKNAIRAYLSRDSFGQYRIPPVRQRPILLMGPPGVGKTQIMEQIAEETGIGLVCYTITHHTRQSALGLPYIEHRSYGGREYAVTEYTMSEIIASVYRSIERSGVREGILFLDEINCISETLTPMMLQFLQCKTFGNQRLPEGWVVVAAGNPPEYNKSVREFDVVTLDRVKRIDVNEDFGVWKEYAYRRGLHGAVISYLEIRKEHFYRIETTADGLQFATARGWEDLSELLYAYESLGLPVDREVIGQYIQLPRIAGDFANYLALYEKYRRVYKVEDILAGAYEPVRAAELAAAPFDERLGVLGLLLARLSETAREAYRQDALTDALHKTLQRIRDAEQAAPAALQLNLAEKQAHIERRRESGSADRDAQRTLLAEAAWLENAQKTLLTEGVPTDAAFDRLRALFAAEPEKRLQLAHEAGRQIEAAFAFLNDALPDSQELILFATELTANFFTSWLIQTFGCEAYYRHNDRLLFDDTRQKIMENIAAARQSEI